MKNNNLTDKISFLENKALNLRIDSIRATSKSNSGHPTSCMSAADIVATIFFETLKYDLTNPKNPNNDRFILSKGHAIPVIYSAWKQLGVISDEELLSLREFDSVLEGHPTPRFEYNEAATGSLGQGLAIGIGMALNAKLEKTFNVTDYTTYVLLGDGEIAEGSVWEAAELASFYKLNNLICIVDSNRLGQTGETLDNHNVDKQAAKFKAFGFDTYTIDGHNIQEILSTIEKAKLSKSKPTAIIAKTYKGHGLQSCENKNNFHGKPFKKEEVEKLIEELKKNFSKASSFENQTKYIPTKPTATNALEETFNVNGKETLNIIDINKDTNSKLFEKTETIATRKAYGYALAALGRKNKNIIALDADVKNSTFTEIFEKEHPDKFFQCFISEQSMVGIATGLESRNKIPFAATFAAFLTRAYDQIRMAGIGRNALRLCGSHCGVSIGQDGPSQMGLEDIAMLRAIPNSIILYPSDGVSAYKLVEQMANYHDGISYLRTSRPATPIIYSKDENFEIGGCKVLKQSNSDQVCIIAAGITLHNSLEAYDELQKSKINVSIIDLYSIKPLDYETIKKVSMKSGNKIITVEDHYLQGGIGEAVSSALSKTNITIHQMAVTKLSRSGSPKKLMEYAQIDSKNIIQKVLEII